MAEKISTLPSWFLRGIADLFPKGNSEIDDDNNESLLDQALRSGRPLRIKLGIDPTGSDIHLGHSILFRKLRAFQDAGHTAVLIIGDFTALIGDPTGKSKTRVQLSSKEVELNAKTYLEQLGLGQDAGKALLDFETPGRLEVRRNSEWLANLDLKKIIDLLGSATVGQMLAKEDFGSRYSSGVPISLHEFLYPLLQGYDSVAVMSDIELGGTDQKFNVAIGRDLQRFYNQKPQFGLLMPILIGLDGVKKMSKSIGNTVGLNEDPLSMYSKLEKVPDSLVKSYLTLLTNLEEKDLPENPRERQKKMALEITSNFHGEIAAKKAQENSLQLTSSYKGMSSADVLEVSIQELSFPLKAFYLVTSAGLCSSTSEARRHIKGGGIRLDGEKLADPNLEFFDAKDLDGKILQLGKKNFRRLKV